MDRLQRWISAALLVTVAVAMGLHGPIAQPEDYGNFADGRTLLGISNAMDVLSNIAFALVALWGFHTLHKRSLHPAIAAGWPGYRFFLVSLLLTALGSAFYHLAPGNDRLAWDRLPIALACAGMIAAVHAETHDRARPRKLLAALASVGIGSVLWWSFTETRGLGDLRPYLLLQASLLLIPVWQALARSPRADRMAFGVAIILYVLAKIAELNDEALFEILRCASGHTVKHLLAAAAGAVIVARLASRLSQAAEPRPVQHA